MLEQLIEDITFGRITLSAALLRAKYISYKINNHTLSSWLKKELDRANALKKVKMSFVPTF